MYRGEIWWANLPDPVGSEPGYRRPVLVIQDDTFTQSRISTIIVVIINGSQIFTLDKTFLVERIGSLPDYLQEEIDEGLRTVLCL
ncbi:MAG: type II toxin-antitoxin system PemK/MazF family toxin [Leptolyngbyaceae bacterium]|nr:type II toxin-antitoxin system PemK/MazF family toxin [Leptolyngbyaceae bacterium]